MKPTTKKRGQKLAKRWEVFSERAKEETHEHIQENLIKRLPHARRVRLLILEWCLLIIVITSLALTQAFWYTQSYSVQAYVDGGTYIEATIGNVNTLNPLFATTTSEKVLSKLLFSTLSTIDYSGHVGLGLASSITPDSTGKVWTVTLKDGLKWSDGEPITLDDVLYTVNLTKDPTVNTSFSSNFSGVTVEQVGDALVFALPSAYADFDATLNIPILPSHILADVAPGQLLEHSFSTNPVTSGAFTFNAMQSVSGDGERIVYLAANDYYYKSKPMLSSFAIHTYSSAEEIVRAISSSDVTATAELSAVYRDQLSSDLIYEKQTAIASGVFAFLNTTSPTLSNVSVRQAIQRGINMDAVRSVLGDEYPLNYPILQSEIELSSYPALPEYNLETAKTAITDAGLSGRTLRLATTNSGYFPELAAVLKTQLENLGFNVDLDISNPGQEFFVNVIRQRNYDILLYEVELGADPDLFAYYHSSQASATGLNLSNYANALVDDLILGARTSMDEAARVQKYETFLTRWVNDVPAIGIYQSSLVYYFNKNVRAFSEDDRLVYATDRFVDVEYWAVNKATKNRTP
jgi:peptide/nickel transport system substrate-binding protein